MKISEKIRELRKTNKMKLQELAEASGVQIATLSRIEHDKMTGTLQSHIAIAKALGMDITQLYEGITIEDSKVNRQTPKTNKDVYVGKGKFSQKVLTSSISNKKMTPSMIKITPHAETHKEQNPEGAEKFFYVLEGTVEARVGGKPYFLSKNNTLHFDASMEHWIINKGHAIARVLCVETPAIF